jgi:hypothetical protein
MAWCEWRPCCREAEYVLVYGCLNELHVVSRMMCAEHKDAMQSNHRKNRVYCPECHGDGQPWENLIPVEMMTAGVLAV